MKSATFWIEKLDLQKHPEGGWYKEIYRSEDKIGEHALPNNFNGERNFSTSIYYLLEGEDFSSFHRIKSDELWHFYTGSSGVEILWVENGNLIKKMLGCNIDKGEEFQHVIPKNKWFAARLISANGFALVGCTVSPGFYFEDFELADERLLSEFPDICTEIEGLIRK